MEKRLLFLLLLACIFAGCKKNDDHLFEQSPDDRINAAIGSYQSKLVTAENGWKALITVNGGNGGTYSFYFKFNDQNRVMMLSDFDSASAVTMQESSYRLKAEQQPTLIFDTYSYVHVLADPNESTIDVSAVVNPGPVGAGLLSDFEFIFDSAKVRSDSMVLNGKVNHSILKLTKATKAEADAFIAGQLGAGFILNKILTYFKRLTIGSQLIDAVQNAANRTLIFSWLDANGALKTFTTNYYLSLGAIMLTNPLVIGNLTVKSLHNLTWNATTQTVGFSTDGGATGNVRGVVVPLRVDIGAPRRWYDYAVNNGNDYWTSYNGFHVNGVDDAFNIKSLVSGGDTYNYLIYWPAYATSNDLFGPVFLNAARTALTINYATAPGIPTFTGDGRAVFVQLGNYGTYPTTGPAAQSRALLYSPAGYYFVQTSANSYDMVSAIDGRSWINWE